MPNIVYALTNPAMPGFVKIGMTTGQDVQSRMSSLYTTGVPFPFECVIAWEIEGKEAGEIESALHTAFGPNRVNLSREFFEIDPEQVQAVLRVIPGRDVTPQPSAADGETGAEDLEAVSEYKKRQARLDELQFLDSLNDPGERSLYERVLSLGRLDDSMLVKWGTAGFSLNVLANSKTIGFCRGTPGACTRRFMPCGRNPLSHQKKSRHSGARRWTPAFLPLRAGARTCDVTRTRASNRSR